MTFDDLVKEIKKEQFKVSKLAKKTKIINKRLKKNKYEKRHVLNKAKIKDLQEEIGF